MTIHLIPPQALLVRLDCLQGVQGPFGPRGQGGPSGLTVYCHLAASAHSEIIEFTSHYREKLVHLVHQAHLVSTEQL